MGEAKRRMRETEVGVEVTWTDDGNPIVRQPWLITIDQLEDYARAVLADDDEPVVPAKSFVLERQEQRMKNAPPVPVMVKVHPDPRVQRILEQIREAPLEQAVKELVEAFDGNLRIVWFKTGNG